MSRAMILTLFVVIGVLLISKPSPLLAEKEAHSHKHEVEEKGLWCNEHDLPEEECFICHPELRQKGRLWCKEHGRYEDRCWLCHPDLEDKERPYCEKHFLYLDECEHLHRENLGKKKPAHSHAHQGSENQLWCKEHDMPEEECFICHPELREKGRLWCNEHERYEDRCWLCHPDLEDKERPYCEKHHLYLDECRHLHPELEQASMPSRKTSSRGKGKEPELYCKEHDLPEHECGLCHPELLNNQAGETTLKVRLPSKESPSLVGIRTVAPEATRAEMNIRAIGEIKFNQNRTAHLTSPVQGVIKDVYVDLGDLVKGGDRLLSIWSPAIGEAASEAVLARQTLSRATRLRKKSINSAQDLEKAEAKNRAALQKLKSLGFSDKQIETLGEDPSAPIMLTITAPFESEVVALSAVHGEYIETGNPLFTLSDRNEVWAILNVSEQDLGNLEVGQSVTVTSRSFPEENFLGRIAHISASIDSRTRMAVVRAVVKNHDGKLRENMFVQAVIAKKSSRQAFLIPAHAVQNIDGTNVAFTSIDSDLYEVRPVTLGDRVGNSIQILSGLNVSHKVVSDGSQAMKSHFLISRLGAGCVD